MVDYREILGLQSLGHNITQIAGLLHSSRNTVRNEIKEKIVQRTIRFKVDYPAIMDNVIAGVGCEVNSYRKLLMDNKESICSILSGPISRAVEESDQILGGKRQEDDETQKKKEELLKNRPHNIRSLKCALQDFKRVYTLLEKNIANREKWLFAYLAYVMSFRAGLLTEDGTLFSEEKIALLYPGFYSSGCITAGIKQWVRCGEWNKDAINSELDYVIERNKALTSADKVRMYELLYLEESDFREGFPVVLENAYAGKLSLDDYVNLIRNCAYGRKYGIEFPYIDWPKIYDGIKEKERTLIQAGVRQPHFRVTIRSDNSCFLPEEWKAYEMIDRFLDGNVLIYEKNRKMYLDLIRTNPLAVFIQMKNEIIDRFDVEMAEATFDGFIQSANKDKADCIGGFKGMLRSVTDIQEDRLEDIYSGLQTLKNLLEQYIEKCQKDLLQIAAVHTTELLKVVSELLRNKDKVSKLY